MRLAPIVLAATLALGACGSGEGQGEVQRVGVPPGASFGQVADSLQARGIVGGGPFFRIYARVTGSANAVKPGTYGFKKGQAWSSILEDLREGRVITAKVVVPEGFSIVRIVPRIAEISGADTSLIYDKVTDPEAPKKYGVPGPTLEGYLYPATYDFPIGVNVDTVLNHMVGAYRKIWTPARQARADSIQMSEREVVTLAAIVEKEAKKRNEMATIASVYHNRLRIGIPLQADPTVQYALGRHRERLLYSDIRKVEENPYNTYKIRGLPPGPIGSPSDKAIDATLYPATTKFLYFVAHPDGSHVFTSSLEEHNRAKRQMRIERERAAQTQ